MSAAEAIERLERATRALEEGRVEAAAERGRVIEVLAGLRVNAEQLPRVEALSRRGAAVVERIRAERRAAVREIQEAAAARDFATALTGRTGAVVVDVQG